VSTVIRNAPPSAVERTLDRLDKVVPAGALDLERDLLAASEQARTMDTSTIVVVGRGGDGFSGDALAEPLRRMKEAGQTLFVIGAGAQPIVDAAALSGGDAFAWTSANKAARQIVDRLGRVPVDPALSGAQSATPIETVTGEIRWLTRFAQPTPAGLVNADPHAVEDLRALWARAAKQAAFADEAAQESEHHTLGPLTSIRVAPGGRDHPAVAERPKDGELVSEVIPMPHDGPPARPLFCPAYNEARAERTGTLAWAVNSDRAALMQGMDLDSFAKVGKRRGPGALAVGKHSVEHRSGQSNGRIVFGLSAVHGPLDREVIRFMVQRQINGLHMCHDIQAGRHPLASGRITLQLVVDHDGQVGKLLVTDSTVNPPLLSCVGSMIWRWMFPKPLHGASATATMSFDFKVEEPPAEGPAAQPRLPFLTKAQTPSAPRPSQWDLSLAVLQQKASLKDRVAEVAAVVCAPDTDDPAILAWWILDHGVDAFSGPTAYLVAANLLREAGLARDATRVLSEAATSAPTVTAVEYRRWKNVSDAVRLRKLTARR